MLLSYHFQVKKSRNRVRCYPSSKDQNITKCFSARSPDRSIEYKRFLQSLWCIDKRFLLHFGGFVVKPDCILGFRKLVTKLQKALPCSERFNNLVPAFSLRLIVGVMLLMTLGAAVTKTPSCKFYRFFKLTSFQIGVSFSCSNTLLLTLLYRGSY